ncbi:MAG: rhodanese-like domain-containing protein [Flavobacteriaceae bacterium]|nr:rhodanese-like domain-containing protein [Flavobacteriaceae bacterium]
MKNINQQEWKELIANDANAVIIDCRSEYEWNDGVIENSTLLDIFDSHGFMNEANKMDKDKNVYVYCRSGVRSVSACQILESIGFINTFNLLGGIMSWQGKIVVP